MIRHDEGSAPTSNSRQDAKHLIVFGMLAVISLYLTPVRLHAADEPPGSCDAIRARIGVVPLADPELLRSLAARQDCAFTSAEVYRAAYGERPLPPPESRESRHRRHHDDDD